MMRRLWLVAALLAPVALAQGEAERLKTAKALYFDGRHAEARAAWEAVRAAGGPDSESAAYWIARCSEGNGETQRAFDEYGAYLASKPSSRTLAEEALTARIGLAAKLYKNGQRQHLGVLKSALQDPSRTVRYFAALQLAGLGAPAGLPALPVLCGIVAKEKDDDLVDRARLAVMRLDAKALSGGGCSASASLKPTPTRSSSGGRLATFIRVRIYEPGRAQPTVSVNLPLVLGDLIFKSLPDEARQELGKQGYDAESLWTQIRKLGATEVIKIQGGDGERVEIWTE